MAYHDALTGLANRAKLEEHLTLALARARRHDRAGRGPLHRPRPLQARQRHARPRRGRRAAAPGRRAPRAPRTRATDLLARHGGDEFMLLLGRPRRRRPRHAPTASPTTCWPRSRRRSRSRATSSRSPPASASPPSPTTAARWPTCSSAPTPRSTTPSATGRGTIRFAAAEQAPATGQLTLTARLRRALARDEFELHYQPVYDVATGEAVAVEALLRWNDPERGMVPPGEFIPAAEDSGLIEPIGDWVVDAVIAQAAAWRELGLRPDIAFNVSPRQLRSDGFAERLLAPLRARRRDASSSPRSPSRRRWPTPSTPCPLLERLARRRPAAGDRRLRRRLLLARPPARPAGARAQDRPLVPARRPGRRARGGDRHRDRAARAGARADRGRRGRRARRAARRSSPRTAARSRRASTWRGRCRPRRSRRCFSPRWRAGSRRPCRRASPR